MDSSHSVFERKGRKISSSYDSVPDVPSQEMYLLLQEPSFQQKNLTTYSNTCLSDPFKRLLVFTLNGFLNISGDSFSLLFVLTFKSRSFLDSVNFLFRTGLNLFETFCSLSWIDKPHSNMLLLLLHHSTVTVANVESERKSFPEN